MKLKPTIEYLLTYAVCIHAVKFDITLSKEKPQINLIANLTLKSIRLKQTT